MALNIIDKKNKRVELLSPAGTYECFESALKSGADAVYLAGSKYGARAYAGNFENDELLRALDCAHLFGKKIFLTVNTTLKNNEFRELFDYIKPFYEAGLDAVIVQDIGVLRFLKDVFPGLEIHVSTQTSVTDSYGVKLLKEFGADRIVLAREVSLDEIKKIIDETGVDLECFIHGAMCYCYSGKCLLSSFLGGRSGNRGRCAQPCRLPYNNCYPLSMKDMYTLHILPSLIEAGISSFKIEGRMKSPDYVATVTGIYRKYIDLFYSNPASHHIEENDERVLLDLYTRSGNCEGYYYEYNGKDMITVDFPGYNGAKEENELVRQYTERKMPQIELKGKAVLKEGEAAELEVFYGDRSIIAYGDIVEKAQNAPVTEDVVIRQLNKTGSQDFCFSQIVADIEGDIFIPVSKLNSLRRDAFSSVRDMILSDYTRKCDFLREQDYSVTMDNLSDINKSYTITAEGYSREVIHILGRAHNVRALIVPCFLLTTKRNNDFKLDSSFVNELKEYSYDKEIYIKLPVIMRDLSGKMYDFIEDILALDFVNGVYVDNYEGLGLLNSIGYDKDIISDIHLYCDNDTAIKALHSLGVNRITLPVELNKHEIKHLMSKDAQLIVYGKIPLMISAQCVRKTLNTCSGNAGYYYINDRKNICFPVLCNCIECNNTIFNSVPVYIKKDSIKAFGSNAISSCRLIFTDEKESVIHDILSYYGDDGDEVHIDYTGGHMNRGVE